MKKKKWWVEIYTGLLLTYKLPHPPFQNGFGIQDIAYSAHEQSPPCQIYGNMG